MNIAPTSLLPRLLGASPPQGLTLRLFTTPYLPTHPTPADISEAAGGGYAPVPLPPEAWSVTGETATLTRQLFIFTGPLFSSEPVRGAFLTWADGSLLAWTLLPEELAVVTGSMLQLDLSLSLGAILTGGLILTAQGAELLLKDLLEIEARSGGLELGLFTCAPEASLDRASALGGDLQEISGGGYARKSLTPETWTIAGTRAVYPEQLFAFTATPAYPGGRDGVRGYFVAVTGGPVLWFEKAARVARPGAGSEPIRVTVRLGCR